MFTELHRMDEGSGEKQGTISRTIQALCLRRKTTCRQKDRTGKTGHPRIYAEICIILKDRR